MTSAAFFFCACVHGTPHRFWFVGGNGGWAVPPGNGSNTYNQWAANNRFHVGDTVWKFQVPNDWVLVVKRADYEHCNASSPISRSGDGDTVFQFRHYGFFYFISGPARPPQVRPETDHLGDGAPPKSSCPPRRAKAAAETTTGIPTPLDSRVQFHRQVKNMNHLRPISSQNAMASQKPLLFREDLKA
ncbi:early nodulin-like protein 2 [Diospyros lotus]|uniref:early nodulin-like protein 2 n=1 Tax=Diospyros lotus TaxID=55363 RepID=UPI002253C6F4|nr:early nodulin-like protein 2 [Diospyros lotus]